MIQDFMILLSGSFDFSMIWFCISEISFGYMFDYLEILKSYFNDIICFQDEILQIYVLLTKIVNFQLNANRLTNLNNCQLHFMLIISINSIDYK